MTNSLGNKRKDGIEALTNVRDRLHDGECEEKSVLLESLKLELEIFFTEAIDFHPSWGTNVRIGRQSPFGSRTCLPAI